MQTESLENYLHSDIPLGKFIYFPEISSKPELECSTTIKVSLIEAIVSEKMTRLNTGEITSFNSNNKGQTVFALFAMTSERKYCISSFYSGNTEVNFLQNLIQLSLEERKEINWAEVRKTLELQGILKGAI